MEPTTEIPKPRKFKLFNAATDVNPDGSLKTTIYNEGAESFETRGVAIGDLGIARMAGERGYEGSYMNPQACYLENNILCKGDAKNLDDHGMFPLDVELLGAPDIPIYCTMYLPNGDILASKMIPSGDHLEKNPLKKYKLSADTWVRTIDENPRHFFVNADTGLLGSLRFEFATSPYTPTTENLPSGSK